VLGGLFIELAMFAVAVPLMAVSEQAVYYAVPLLAVGTAFAFGWWAAKPLTGRFVLHGALAAVAASVMYIALTTASGVAGDLPLLYHVSHVLRVMGGAAGGAFAARRATATRVQAGTA
jgi:hypothetical protein